jgi:hypothetical protein
MLKAIESPSKDTIARITNDESNLTVVNCFDFVDFRYTPIQIVSLTYCQQLIPL